MSASEFLTGQLLVSQPRNIEGHFAHTSVLVAQHNLSSAWGVVINRVAKTLTMQNIMAAAGIEYYGNEPIYVGGPVEPTRVHVVHSLDWSSASTLKITDDIGITGDVSVSGSTGAVTFSIGQAVATGSNVRFNSLGVGTAASGIAGEIRATNNVTAYYSDERLKTKIGNIENALDKVEQIETMVYHANEIAVALGYDASVIEVGVTAQSVQKVMPQTVAPAPIDDKYLTVRYERLIPLLIEAIKELSAEVKTLKAKIE